MKRFVTLFFLLICLLSFSITAHADGFGLPEQEIAKIQRVIRCERASISQKDEYLGMMWGCYGPEDNPRLWLTCKDRSDTEVKNIKLSSIRWHNQRLDSLAESRARALMRVYAPEREDEIAIRYSLSRYGNDTYKGKYNVYIEVSIGNGADHHLMLITPGDVEPKK